MSIGGQVVSWSKCKPIFHFGNSKKESKNTNTGKKCSMWATNDGDYWKIWLLVSDQGILTGKLLKRERWITFASWTSGFILNQFIPSINPLTPCYPHFLYQSSWSHPHLFPRDHASSVLLSQAYSVSLFYRLSSLYLRLHLRHNLVLNNNLRQ